MSDPKYRDPSRINFDPNMVNSGRRAKHVVRLTFGMWDYRKTVGIEVFGNTQGLAVIEHAVDVFAEQLAESEETIRNDDLLTLILSRPAEHPTEEEPEDTLETCDDENRYDDWLKDMLVSAEIIVVEEAGYLYKRDVSDDAEFDEDVEEEEGGTDEEGDEEDEEAEEDDDVTRVVDDLEPKTLNRAAKSGHKFVLHEGKRYSLVVPENRHADYGAKLAPISQELIDAQIARVNAQDTIDVSELSINVAEEADFAGYRFLRFEGKLYRVIVPKDLDKPYSWEAV